MDAVHERIFPPAPPPQPMMQMTMMDSALGQAKPAPKPPAYIYPATSVPIPHPNNPVASTYMIPWEHNQLNVPTIKKYNITMQGMDGNLTSASQLFEDILPESNIALNRMTTLGERTILHSYIRSILLKRGDGEEIAFNDKKPELINLLSYMKMLEINPYHFSRISNNAYKTMADNFVMFRSCYPIRLNKKSNNLTCAGDNIGANVRVYSMSVYDELANSINKDGIVKIFSDVWREILFYTFIREEILKKKICPHFPFMHSYYITENTGIDFDKAKAIKSTTDITNDTFAARNEKIASNLFKDTITSMITQSRGNVININVNKLEKYSNPEIFNFAKKKNIRLKNRSTIIADDDEYDINRRSDKCIVAITEAPDMNIIDWSTRTYIIEDGPIRRQINSGVHSVLTWKSILFQMMMAFYTMEQKRFVIRDFSWERNIFIKSFSDTGAIGYWKYKLKGVDFYIPNMKALVIFDSCFDKVDGGYTDTGGGILAGFKFKTMGEFYKDTDQLQLNGFTINPMAENARIDEELINCFRAIFNRNQLNTTFRLYGGTPPDAEIMTLIEQIGDENYRDYKRTGAGETLLIDIIIKYFGCFMHNKIGLMVEQVDKQQLFTPGEFIDRCNTGDLIGYNGDAAYDIYYWGIYIRRDNANNHNILTLDNGNYVTRQVPGPDISRVHGTIAQIFKPDHKLTSSDELLEIYNVSY